MAFQTEATRDEAGVPPLVAGCSLSSRDTVVFTSVLCTVKDVGRAPSEAERVLRPGVTVAVLEHLRGQRSAGPLAGPRDPVWKRLNGGCHPNRDIHAALDDAGFTITGRERFDPFPAWIPARPRLAATGTR